MTRVYPRGETGEGPRKTGQEPRTGEVGHLIMYARALGDTYVSLPGGQPTTQILHDFLPRTTRLLETLF